MKELVDFLLKEDNFIITGHKDPDGDCIGSSIALGYILEKLDKKVTVVFESKPFFELNALGFDIPIYYPETLKLEKNKKYNLILLDAHQWYRLGKLEEKVRPFVNFFCCIDHHPDNGSELEGDLNYFDTGAAAIGEIIYDLLIKIGRKDILDEKIALALYLSIYSDTGGYKYSNTTKKTHLITAELFDYGINPYFLYSVIHENKTYTEIKLLAKALDNLKLTEDGKIAYIIVDKNMLESVDAKIEDIRNFTYYPRAIKTVEIALVFIEKENYIDISFRSKGKYKVNEIAHKFGGGGHPNAAGAEVYNEKLNKVVNDVLNECKKIVKSG